MIKRPDQDLIPQLPPKFLVRRIESNPSDCHTYKYNISIYSYSNERELNDIFGILNGYILICKAYYITLSLHVNTIYLIFTHVTTKYKILLSKSNYSDNLKHLNLSGEKHAIN